MCPSGTWSSTTTRFARWSWLAATPPGPPPPPIVPVRQAGADELVAQAAAAGNDVRVDAAAELVPAGFPDAPRAPPRRESSRTGASVTPVKGGADENETA